MGRVVIAIVAIVVVGFGVLFFTSDDACSAGSCKTNVSSSASVAEQAVKELKADSTATVLDVRTLEEWNQGHAKGAVHFELAKLQSGQLPEVEKGDPLYVYCRSGNRSAEAAAILKEAGYTDVRDIGPLSSLEEAGATIE